MSRWVDADLIAQQMRELPHEYSNKEQRARTGGIASCQEIVRDAPSIDLVFCEECIHFTKLSDGWGRCNAHDRIAQTIDFCSWAERKESE